MKMQILQRVISMFLVLCMVTLPLCTGTVYATGEDTQQTTPIAELETSVKAELDAADAAVDSTSDSQSTLTATIYNAGVAGDATESVTLTESGLAGDGTALKLNDIARDANLLEIRWKFPANQSHTLTIAVPVGLYIVDQSWTTKEIAGSESLLQDPTFTPFDLDPDTDGLQQGTGSLSNAYTGTLTYTTEAVPDTNMDREEYITLFVAVDVRLWDKGDMNTQSNEGGVLAAEAIDGSLNAIEITDGSATRILPDVYTLDKVPADFEARSAKESGSKLVSDSTELQNPIQFAFYDQDYTKYEWAYKEVRATYTVTYVDSNGDTKTIPVKDVTIPTEKRPGAVVSNFAKYGSLSFDEATQTAVITDYYTEAVEMMIIGEPQFIVDASLNIPHDASIKVAADVTMISYNGSVRTVQGVYTNATYKSEVAYEIEFKNTNGGMQYTAEDAWYGDTTDIIDYLGTLTFRNGGIGAIPEGMQVEVVFDTTFDSSNPTPKMLVSSFRLFALEKSKQPTITVTADYIYQDANGNWVAGSEDVVVKTVQSNTTHGALLCLGTGKYLTKISYTMPEIPGDTWLYRSGSPARDESGGTFHGRLLTGANDAAVVSQLTLKIPNDANTYSLTTKTQVRALDQVKYIGYLNTMTGLSAKAGSDISLNLTMSAYDYGYTSSTYVPSPTIFAVLPKGITVTGASFAHKSNKSDITAEGVSITSWTHTDGNIVYKIELGTGAAFGGFRVPASSAAKLGFKDDQYCYVQLDMHLSASLRASSYNLQELLTLTTKIPTKELYSTYGQASGSNATVARYAKSYTHGVVDGDTTAYTFSSLANNELTQLQIIPRTNGITFTPAVSETGVDSWRIGTSSTAAITVAPGDTYFYRVTAQNNSDEGVPQPNTALYIPIPHPENTLPTAMGGATTETFGVRLTKAVEVAGETAAAWDIRYAFDITATENDKYFSNGIADFTGDGITYAKWYTAAEIEAANLHWEDVLCIKAVVSEGYINANGENAYPKGAADTFTMELRMIPGVVGETISYASATWNLYDSAGTTPKGGVLFNTAFAKVIRGKRVEIREVFLGTHEDTGAPDSIEETLENYAGVAFNITNVSLSDVTLQTKAVINANKNGNNLPDAAEQDATFGITMGLNSNGTTDLAAVSAPHSLGASETYVDNTLQLDLSYYYQFLDATTPRYADVTVSDPDGSVVITYRVNILRKLVLVAADTGVVAGFYPNGGFGSPDTATFSRDGIATAQFVFDNYNTDINGAFSIALNTAFNQTSAGKNPSLTLIDMTDATAPVYYSYKANSKASKETNIPLTYFENMDGSGNYTQPTGTVDKVNYVLVIDLTDAAFTSNYTIRMNTGDTAGTPLYLKAVAGMVSFNWNAPVCDNLLTDENMELALTLKSSTVNSDANHLWMGRSESVKVRITNGEQLFPAGSYLTDGETIYPACPGGGYIKVPVGNISAQGGTLPLSLTLHIPAKSVSTDTISLYVAYLVSSPYHKSIKTACGVTYPSDTYTITESLTDSYALRVDGDSHLITQDDKTATFTVYRTDGESDLSWNAYLKTASGYSTPAAYSATGISAANGATFAIDASTWTVGTYLIEFTASSNEKSYYTLIVLQ